MTDLVTRLRAYTPKPLAEGDLPVFNEEWAKSELCREAADKIEQLIDLLRYIDSKMFVNEFSDFEMKFDFDHKRLLAEIGGGKP